MNDVILRRRCIIQSCRLTLTPEYSLLDEGMRTLI